MASSNQEEVRIGLLMLNEIVVSDCIEFMQWIPDNSIDSCVTDPPYGLSFMGKKWDTLPEGKEMQDWFYLWGKELFRIMKHGSHILVFSGARTYHRMACAMEDAGFEIRDMIEWIYGSGFPKGQNIAKAIDKKLGKKGKVVARGHSGEKRTVFTAGTDDNPDWFGGDYDVTIPITEIARLWEGWNTQLKPAHEPILLARKPIAEKSIVDNVLRYGTGAINIDATRIAVNPDVDDMHRTVERKERESRTWREGSGFKNEHNEFTGVLPSGRYPSNLILSHHPDCKMIQSGEVEVKDVSTHASSTKLGKHGIYGDYEVPINLRHSFDVKVPEMWQCVEGCPVEKLGEQARFFYCAKASKNERSAGLEERNPHVTVKPIELMRYLVRMITPKGGVVIDPFVGSGTTAIAALLEGFNFLACDKDESSVDVARQRLEHWRTKA